MSPRIKICGITRLEDAEAAVELGVHALGFVFWPESPRAITRDAAHAIARRLPPHVARVGVFVNAPVDQVLATVRDVGLDVVQLHGDEDAHEFARVPAQLIKSVALEDASAVARALALPPPVTPLVDAADRVRRGGTGRAANWPAAAHIAASRPIILAGGLSAANVAEAIAAVRPWGVDVSSGVESAPGRKSLEKLTAFCRAVRGLEPS
jgi:phosphoribosylanthranilate isomerase